MNIDKTNWLILEELQKDGRMPLKEISRRVGISSPAISERMQKMEEAGIINGYQANVNLKKLGYPMGVYISAKIRFGQAEKFYELIKNTPEIMECHKLTGNDCLLIRANVKNTDDLERLNTGLSHYGELTTSLVLSSVVDKRIYNYSDKRLEMVV
ncbi:Lrp/AsnC family transcriptional regulator [Aureibaculum conchae]|uniref:Lrp/AsnC family transcriptional regulator n=1 Tax=Aureibaculum sp. 2308TA14-22 TaxID=3108392 RepID=UPI003392CF96